MAKVLPTKKTERAGVNQFRSLLESAGHIVQEIDGGNDYGEDCYLSFTEYGRRTGDIVAVQVKSGTKYRRAVGYAIPCRGHVSDWSRSRIPVIGVIYDPEIRKLYWVNMTKYLIAELGRRSRPRSIPVGEEAILDANTVTSVVSDIREFIARKDNCTPRKGSATQNMAHALRRYIYRNANQIPSVPIGGHSIPLFATMTALLEPRKRLLVIIAAILSVFVVGTALAVAGPGLYSAAEEQHYTGWIWLTCFYGSITCLLVIGLLDSKAKRAALVRAAAYAIILVGWNISTGGVLWPEIRTFDALFISAVPVIAKACGLYLPAYYILQEISRRRRLRSAYGNRSLD